MRRLACLHGRRLPRRRLQRSRLRWMHQESPPHMRFSALPLPGEPARHGGPHRHAGGERAVGPCITCLAHASVAVPCCALSCACEGSILQTSSLKIFQVMLALHTGDNPPYTTSRIAAMQPLSVPRRSWPSPRCRCAPLRSTESHALGLMAHDASAAHVQLGAFWAMHVQVLPVHAPVCMSPPIPSSSILLPRSNTGAAGGHRQPARRCRGQGRGAAGAAFLNELNCLQGFPHKLKLVLPLAYWALRMALAHERRPGPLWRQSQPPSAAASSFDAGFWGAGVFLLCLWPPLAWGA
jgi:hypothetical protein